MFCTKSQILLHAVTLTTYNLKLQRLRHQWFSSLHRRLHLELLSSKSSGPGHPSTAYLWFEWLLYIFFAALLLRSFLNVPAKRGIYWLTTRLISVVSGQRCIPMQPKHLCLRVFRRLENLLSSSPSSWVKSASKRTDPSFS